MNPGGILKATKRRQKEEDEGKKERKEIEEDKEKRERAGRDLGILLMVVL